MKLLRVISVLVALLCASVQTQAATSASRHGITWTFAADMTTGTFWNGDPWVVGPVTVTSISPLSTLTSGRTMNGSMVNPSAGVVVPQGFDSSMTANSFSSALNRGRPNGATLSAENPLILPAGSSLISSRSHATAGKRPQLTDIAVLTVLETPPPAGSFRPPYCGTDKTIPGNIADLDYSFLANLTGIASAPSFAAVLPYHAKMWTEIKTEFGGREMHASNNQPNYGRDMALQTLAAIERLNISATNEEKQQLLGQIVQYGLDIWGAAVTGGYWINNGGHNHGRKIVLLIAGRAMNRSDILAYGNKALNNIFQDDHQVFYVGAGDVGRSVQNEPYEYSAGPRYRYTYSADMVGLPEWAIRTLTINNAGQIVNENVVKGSNIGTSYRGVNRAAGMGFARLAKLMGLDDDWNNPVYFEYYERAGTWTTGEIVPAVTAEILAETAGMVTVYTPPTPVLSYAHIGVGDESRIRVGFNGPVQIGAGGYAGFTLTTSSTTPLSLNATGPSVSDTELYWGLNRRVFDNETLTLAYANPGNGLEYRVNGADIGSWSAITLTPRQPETEVAAHRGGNYSLSTPAPVTDTTPPSPNPSTFAIDPVASGPTGFVCTATTATDASGAVEYSIFYSGAWHGWQPSPTFTVSGLTPSTLYSGIRVKSRDLYGNETAESEAKSVTTAAAAPRKNRPPRSRVHLN